MYCNQCGREIPNDSKFCYKCGARVVVVPIESCGSVETENDTRIKATGLFVSYGIFSILKRCGAWFSFNGRRSRMKYFGVFVLLSVLGGIIESMMMGAVAQHNSVAIIFCLLLCIPWLWLMCVNVTRRCHDLDYKGYLGFCPIISFLLGMFQKQMMLGLFVMVMIIPGLFLLFRRGTDGSNQYGVDPLQS